MGNVDSRCKHGNNYMGVQTYQQIYNPGTQVTGQIYMQINDHSVPVKDVKIEVKGKEKVSFEYTKIENDS